MQNIGNHQPHLSWSTVLCVWGLELYTRAFVHVSRLKTPANLSVWCMQQELKTQILRGEFYWEAIESNLSYIRPSDFISKCWSKIHFTQDLGLVLLFPKWPNIFDKMLEFCWVLTHLKRQLHLDPCSEYRETTRTINSLHELFRVSLFRISTG